MMAPNLTSRVTEYVPVIIQFIQGIMDKGHAYVGADGTILFLPYINMPIMHYTAGCKKAIFR